MAEARDTENSKKTVTFLTPESGENPKGDAQEQEPIQFCLFCNKVAEFICGNCDQAPYCTFEHQKADWPAHKKKCIKPEYKLKELKKEISNLKKNFFDKLCRGLFSECQIICNELVELNLEVVTKFPAPEHQIEYGASICANVKFHITIKNFNEAQDILNAYMRDKATFIRDTKHIPEKLDKQDPAYAKKLSFVEGKFKLISVLCGLTHQIVRNAIPVIEILLEHQQKFYGPDSLQVSNIYFELANYFNFMNQQQKAIACFLVASRIRKEKGLTCLFNVALLFLRLGQYHNAIKYFYETLQMIQQHGDHHKFSHTVYMGLGYAFKKLNHFDLTVENFEKALCLLSNKRPGQSDKFSQSNIVKDILKKLSIIYRKEFEDDQAITLPNEVNEVVAPKPVLTNQNLEQLWEIEKDNSDKKRTEEWMKSFKNQVDKTKFKSTVPMTNHLIKKVLFENHFIDNKDDDSFGASYEVLKMDLNFMAELSSTEVRYMHELNRMLVDIKDKETIYDIVDNSNLMQILDEYKRNKFLQLNQKLRRPLERHDLMLETKKVKLRPGNQALKLNLQSLSKNQ